jgi:hypothetical protein
MLRRNPDDPHSLDVLINWDEFPSYYLSKICTCPPNVYGPYPPIDIKWDRGFVATCSECHKPHAHLLDICNCCDEVFLKDFKHPGFDWKDPRCWQCLELAPDYIATGRHDDRKSLPRTKKESEFRKLAEGPSVFSF